MVTLLSVLSGDIQNDNGVWRTTDYVVRYGSPAGTPVAFRIPAAAAYLRHFNKDEATVLLQGGLADETYPSLASVMMRELLEQGAPAEVLQLEEESETTYQQLLALQQAALAAPSAAVEILSSEWHLPRVRAMVEHAAALGALRARTPQYVAAEEVLIAEDPLRWKEKIDAARARPDAKARAALEQKGVDEIRAGTYGYR